MNYHFISGLPRSGSTLLAALLRQNPRVHADMTSPVAKMYMALLQSMSDSIEVQHHFHSARRRRLLGAIFDAYYAEVLQERTVIFDTNRSWNCVLPGLIDLFPHSRVVCCVRDIAWVVDSLERLVRNNPHQLSALFGYQGEATVYERVEMLCAANGMVGFALDALKQACFSAEAGLLLLIRYETLCRSPEEVLKRIYSHLGEPEFVHNMHAVHYSEDSFDRSVNTPGLHHVRSSVSYQPRETILPPDIFARLQSFNFWDDQAYAEKNIAII